MPRQPTMSEEEFNQWMRENERPFKPIIESDGDITYYVLNGTRQWRYLEPEEKELLDQMDMEELIKLFDSRLKRFIGEPNTEETQKRIQDEVEYTLKMIADTLREREKNKPKGLKRVRFGKAGCASVG